jgi:hypothetical protein
MRMSFPWTTLQWFPVKSAHQFWASRSNPGTGGAGTSLADICYDIRAAGSSAGDVAPHSSPVSTSAFAEEALRYRSRIYGYYTPAFETDLYRAQGFPDPRVRTASGALPGSMTGICGFFHRGPSVRSANGGELGASPTEGILLTGTDHSRRAANRREARQRFAVEIDARRLKCGSRSHT